MGPCTDVRIWGFTKQLSLLDSSTSSKASRAFDGSSAVINWSVGIQRRDMERKSPAQLGYKQVQDETAKLLRPFGFKRKGSILFKRDDAIFGVLQFQSGPSSTKTEISFTINFGVLIRKLESGYQHSQIVKYPSSMRLHVRRRVGEDSWWSVTNETDVPAFSKYFSELVLSTALPFIQKYMKIENILSMWEDGNAPGLTERQRFMHLSRLRTVLGITEST